jgi:hypothetical protein
MFLGEARLVEVGESEWSQEGKVVKGERRGSADSMARGDSSSFAMPASVTGRGSFS